MDTDDGRMWFTKAEAAQLLGMKPETLQKRTDRGRGPRSKVDDTQRRLYLAEDVMRLKVSRDLQAEVDRNAQAPELIAGADRTRGLK